MAAKLQIEICLISARGLRRTSSLWKLQWYAVGWIDPENKYCTKIDASGTGNPVWKTGFSATIDPSEATLQDLVLHVEVHSREPVFLKQSLFGSATVVLKEFLEKYSSQSEAERKAAVEEVGSFQLRKKSDKPVGFVDVSIRISEKEDPGKSLYLGPEEGFHLNDEIGGVNACGSFQPSRPYPRPFPPPPNYPLHHQLGGANQFGPAQPNYPLPQASPPPPPPINACFAPPTTSSYINMPSSVDPPRHGPGLGPGFGMGVAAGGALAAGAMIYGDDLMSGFQLPHASLSVSTYPPF